MSEIDITCPNEAASPQGASRSGDYRISWSGPDPTTYRLVERASDEGEATVLYEGPQRASTVTGRRAGDYTYRVGIVEQGEVRQWSERCEVEVRPYPLELAFLFFGFGLLVTVATVVLVVAGHRAHRRGELG